jgi:hypothetical protein
VLVNAALAAGAPLSEVRAAKKDPSARKGATPPLSLIVLM